ncbi:sugar phosphate isomerase/epimerase [Hoeflea sp. G2-23]|uniref:Sugar phosphate isomerase/epimerase n=1 Tax=Hoeflea algicola TaxID=2983763 RepID=A0ABT3Z9T2_9HYPH|nr:TIM barrel protein [Hoeflea algicola]MCY0148523.1 sugar phosphate isomerase/epimerase [Hoeflea algicola]
MTNKAPVKLSVNNGFMMKRWPEPQIWADLIAQELEITDVQFSLDLVNLEFGAKSLGPATREILTACAQSGIEISSVFSGLGHYCQNLMSHPEKGRRLEAFEQYKLAIDFTAALGVDTFGGHMGAMSVRDHGDEARRAALHDELMELVEQLALHAEGAGLKHLLWEPMPVAREWPSTLEECHELSAKMQKLPGAQLGLCLDVGHCCRYDLGGEDSDPYRWVRELAHVSPIIHLQQTDGTRDYHWPFTEANNEIGIIHPEPLHEAIAQAENSVITHLTFEVFPAFEQPDDAVILDMKASCDYWRGCEIVNEQK